MVKMLNIPNVFWQTEKALRLGLTKRKSYLGSTVLLSQSEKEALLLANRNTHCHKEMLSILLILLSKPQMKALP